MLEQITLSVRVSTVQPQAVDKRHDLREHRRLINGQSRALHEVDRRAIGHLGEESKDLVADETYQGFTREPLGPDRPPEALARNGLHPLGGRVKRILQLPLTGEEAFMVLLEDLGARRVLGVNALDQVEKEKERELLGVVDRIGIASTVEVIADLID
jgi:hypothetical protein